VLVYHIPLSDLPNQLSPLSTWGLRPVSNLIKFHQLNQSVEFKESMAATWYFDHSAIYRILDLCLAIANAKDRSEGCRNATRNQSNSYNSMHIQISYLRYKKNKINSRVVVRCTGACLSLARGYRPRLVLAPAVPRVLALRGLSQLCMYETLI
jgi:hypothetical protein